MAWSFQNQGSVVDPSKVLPLKNASTPPSLPPVEMWSSNILACPHLWPPRALLQPLPAMFTRTWDQWWSRMDPNTISTNTVSITFWRSDMWHVTWFPQFLRIPKPPPTYFYGITHPGRRFQEMRWYRRPFLSGKDDYGHGRGGSWKTRPRCRAAMWHGCQHDQHKLKIKLKGLLLICTVL